MYQSLWAGFWNNKTVIDEGFHYYLNFSKKFVICTDASDYHLGVVIAQEGKLIVFFGRKLNKTQQNYATTKIYALGIV